MSAEDTEFWPYVFRRTKNACVTLFTFMIPISIIIHLIQEWDLLTSISEVLTPVMQIVGLPAEMALVWLTSMVVNIYGGFLVLFAIHPALSEPLTVAQLTTLCVMTLIAHTFPIELMIAKKTGVRVWVMFLIRFGFAVIAGIILINIYTAFGWLQDPVNLPHNDEPVHLSWGAWALNELQHYAIITCVIFVLVILIRILQVTGIIQIVNTFMQPALGWLGIGKEMLPLTVVGLTLGIAYGGGLLIEESHQGNLKPREIFYSMTLMGLFHSIIEDTILMLSLGGHWSGVLIFRPLFAFIITFLIVKVTRGVSDEKMEKVCMS